MHITNKITKYVTLNKRCQSFKILGCPDTRTPVGGRYIRERDYDWVIKQKNKS